MSISSENDSVSRAHGIRDVPPSNTGGSKLSTLSVGELRTAMQHHLRSTGALRQLKTQLRGMVLTELLQHPKTARMLIHGTSQSVPSSRAEAYGKLEDKNPPTLEPLSTPSVDLTSGRRDQTLQTWSCGLADALVENHLRRTRRAMSLSIFSTEAEVHPFSVSGAPSEEEQYLAQLFRQTHSGAPANPEDEILTPSPSRSAKSVLQRLVEDCVARQGLSNTAESPRHLHSCSTQTDAVISTDQTTSPLNSLECRLAAVDAKYALTFSQLKQTRGTGEQPFFLRSEVERRLQQYKSDMHAQLRSEYEQKYNTFTRVKLQEARDDAERRYRVLVQCKTEELTEMERSAVVKLEQEQQRLKLAWEDIHQQRSDLERRQCDAMKQLSEYDAAKQRSDAEIYSWKEKTRALQLQCAKWEELCETRLMELDGARSREGRRVEDIRRLQAEHAAELRLKDEEISRLRYRLRLVAREGDHPRSGTTPEGSADRKRRADATLISSLAQPSSATSQMDPQQAYSMHLRFEELQRNASGRQQERWDAAWASGPAVTATGIHQSGSNAHTVVSSVPPSIAVMPSAGHVFSELHDPNPAVGSRSPQATADQWSHHRPADTDERVTMSVAPSAALTLNTGPAAPSPPSPKENPPMQTATPAAAASFSTAPDERQKSTTSSKKSPSTSVPSTRPSSSASTTQVTLEKTQNVQSVGIPRTQSSESSGARTSVSSSTSAAPAPMSARDAYNEDSEIRSAAVARLKAVAAEEEDGRGEMQSEEASARNSIAWLEGNRRELLAEELKRERGKDSGSDSSVGRGAAPPWKKLGGGTLGHQPGGSAVNIKFDESFSSDDSALLHDSNEDESDF